MSSLLVFKWVYRLEEWRYSQSWLYFRPSFENYCPSNLLSGSSPPPFPKSKYSIQYSDSAWLEGGGGGGGVLSCIGSHVSDQIQNVQNCFTTPNKNLGWEGAADK